MLRIWGRLSSINVQKVVWCARELHLDHERIDIGNARDELHTPEFLALNPNAMIPVIEDIGQGNGDVSNAPFVLWESNAIVRYLCARYGAGRLSPLDLRERANLDRWMDWQTTAYSPSMVDAFLGLIRTAEAERDPAKIERSRQRAEQTTAILDRALADRTYIGGDAFSMADISLGCAAHRWFGLPLDHAPHPNVRRWLDTLYERRAAQAVLTLPLA
jgi:glutathione S-transferase